MPLPLRIACVGRGAGSAGLAALGDSITPRTQFLIAHHMEAHAYHDGTIGFRARLRLKQSADFDVLLLLSELDRAGRQRGAQVGTIAEALAFIQAIENEVYLDQ